MLINTVMASMFLVTPILWRKEEIGRYAEFIYLNPFAAVIDILRNPLWIRILILNLIMFQ